MDKNSALSYKNIRKSTEQKTFILSGYIIKLFGNFYFLEMLETFSQNLNFNSKQVIKL